MIYFVQPTAGGPVKIGHSRDVDARLRQLETAYGRPLALLATMPGDRDTEAEVHERFAHLRLGRTEQFRPGAELMAFIGRPLLASANPDAVEVMEPTDILIANFRGSQEFKAWLHRLAKADRETVSGLIERALVQYARTVGFSREAPER